MRRGERGWLVVKIKVEPAPCTNAALARRLARRGAAAGKRIERQIDLKPGLMQRVEFGLGMAKVSVSGASAARAEGLLLAAASISRFGEKNVEPHGENSARWRKFGFLLFYTAPTSFFGRTWLGVTPALAPVAWIRPANWLPARADRRGADGEEEWERASRERDERHERQELERVDREAAYYRPAAAAVSDDDADDNDDEPDALLKAAAARRRERRVRERAETAALEAREDEEQRSTTEKIAAVAEPLDEAERRRKMLVCGSSGAAVRAEASLDSALVGELPFGSTVTVTGNRLVLAGRARTEIAEPFRGWLSAKLLRFAK